MKNKYANLLGLWVVNLVIFLVANLFFSDKIVLGNALLPYVAAILITTFLLTAAIFLIKPAVNYTNLKIKGGLNWFLIYIIANIVLVWVLARLATITGFGITSFLVAVVLGIVLNIGQWGFAKVISKK